ncbi:MAG: amidohydrolase [Archangiaceae bacterium]|nr:amidohydrolase [Archangiaceae bacterium]
MPAALLAALTLCAAPLSRLDAAYEGLDALYRDLHQNPELSRQETKTADKLAAKLKALGFTVTQKVGGTGVVGVLANGKGPTVLLRTDLDGLPVEEKTNLPYASRVTATDQGKTVAVMHACGHDMHMSVWTGAATVLAQSKDAWKGTLVMVGQPAEEEGDGARAMIADKLFERFPRPDYAVALHVKADLAAGVVGWVKGYAFANVDSLDVTLYGRGGHGAAPHTTIDPVVMAAKTVVSLQTLVAREVRPTDPAVVTVGSIHGGTRPNIIPDEVKLQLTLRSYKPEVRQALIDGVTRIVKAEAAGARAPREPLVKVDEGPSAVYNDPALTGRLVTALGRELGEQSVVEVEKIMGAEDFSEYMKGGMPTCMLWLGATEPAKLQAARAPNAPQLPSTHSALFAPDRERTLRTGVRALTTAALELFTNEKR